MPHVVTGSTTRRGVVDRLAALRLLGVVVGALLLSAAFALAAPLGSSPDEPDHWRFAYAVQTGQESYGGFVHVPASLQGYPAACVNGDPDAGASCVAGISDVTTRTEVFTSAWNYPQLYYWVTGWPLLIDAGQAGLIAVRLLSAGLSALLLGLAFAPWMGRSSWPMRLALVLTVTPSLVYFSGSVNPQGFEIATLVAAWSWTVLVMSRLRTATYRSLPVVMKVVWPVLLVVSVNARVLTFWYVAVLLVVSWLAVGPPLRRVLRDPGVLVVTGVVLLAATVRLLALLSTTEEAVSPDGNPAAPLRVYVISSLWRALDDPAHAIGLLGWLDTDVPSVSTGVWFVLLGLLVALAAPHLNRRHVAAIAVTLVALTATWAVLDVILTRAEDRPFWQARYGLGLLVGVPVLLAAATLGLARQEQPAVRNIQGGARIRSLAAAGVAFAWLAALAFLMVRYMWSAHWFGPVGHAGWAPYPSAPLVVLLGILGAPLLAASAVLQFGRRRRVPEQPVDPYPVVAAGSRDATKSEAAR